MRPKIKIKRLSQVACCPERAYTDDSGFDLYAASTKHIKPGRTAKIPTGIAIELTPGYELQIRPRSSVSAKGILCHFGTVDNGYRGEICFLLTNLSPVGYNVIAGCRYAQAVVKATVPVDIEMVQELSCTDRGEGGFGSTGD